MDEQAELMKMYLEHIHEIVPESQRHRYHLILGKQIIGTYDTFQEMKNAEQEKFPFVACVTYMPKCHAPSPPMEVK